MIDAVLFFLVALAAFVLGYAVAFNEGMKMRDDLRKDLRRYRDAGDAAASRLRAWENWLNEAPK